ncbi:MAG: hypothetical protein JRH20_27650 [Deltaproteobacteria bacterium]|nr:hypothetical protein [Deltaproteobacteria bacterium]
MGGFCAHIQIFRDGELMLQRQLTQRVVIGESPCAALPLPGLEADVEFLTPVPQGFTLRLPAGVRGKLRAADRILRVQDGLLHDPRPEPLIFTDGDRGVLWLPDAHLQLRFSIVRKVQRPWRPHLDRPLALALGCTAVVLLSSAILVTRYGARPKSERDAPGYRRPSLGATKTPPQTNRSV